MNLVKKVIGEAGYPSSEAPEEAREVQIGREILMLLPYLDTVTMESDHIILEIEELANELVSMHKSGGSESPVT